MSAPLVLVVEDNPRTRKLLRVALESDGCTVLEAADGAEALARLDPVPDLVVIDLLLPDTTGVDLRARIAAAPGCATVPAIAVSGYAQGLEAAVEGGFADRLRKPVEPSTLIGTVRRWLPEGDERRARGSARVLVADDTDIQRKLTAFRLRESGYEVFEAGDGLTALQLARTEHPDVVLADVLMPGLDGFELCRSIAEDDQLGGTPVVLASSVFVERADRELATQAGAVGFVAREPDLKEVVGAVARALGAPAARVATVAGYDVLHAQRLGRALGHQADAYAALELELEEREAQLAVLAGISATLARTSDPATIMEEILARCVEATGVAGAEYRRAGADGITVTVGAPPVVSDEQISRAIEQRSPVVDDDGVVMSLHGGDQDLGVVVLGGLETPFTHAQMHLCQAIALQLCQAVEIARAHAEVVGSREQVVERLALAVTMRDGSTGAHTQRMSASCERLGLALGLDPEHCRLLRIASAMHDIGKVATPDAILLKPGRLTPEERVEIERHAEIGHAILAGSGSALLDLAATIAISHHERWDGGGYPNGLRGTQIPLEGRIAAVADVYDALISERPYRAAMPLDAALAVLRDGRGTHFDPAVLDALEATLPRALPAGRAVCG